MEAWMRLYTIFVSVIVHAAVLIILVIVPLYAMDALPMARSPITFVSVAAADLPDVPPPPPSGGRPPTPTDLSTARAPITAPPSIADEVPRAPLNPGPPAIDGPPGVLNGVGHGGVLLNIRPPDPPPTPTGPLRTGGDIRPPRKIHHIPPVYPPIAQSARVEGTVILDTVIGEDGRVRDVRVLRSIALLDQAAIDAVRQWRFTPTLLNGHAVPVVMTVTVSFQLTR
jgi:protein TonB